MKTIQRYDFLNYDGTGDMQHPANKQWEDVSDGDIIRAELWPTGTALAVVQSVHECDKCVFGHVVCQNHYGRWCQCCVPLEDAL